MASLHDESLQDLVQRVKAPISRQSIDEKVEVFERRLNGKILPFLGLHGTLLALIYLIKSTPVVESLALGHPLLPTLTLAPIALLCGLLTTAYYFTGRVVAGGAAVTICVALLAALLPLEAGLAELQLAAALALCLALLTLNGAGRVDDYEFNTVWLYLPFILLLVGRLTGIEQMLAAVTLYGPAIYLKFRVQPTSNKVPLGFSVLIFLGMIIRDNPESKWLIAIMVMLVLVLFVVYSFRLRHVTGSSYRHFLADAIIMGLWALLVGLIDSAIIDSYILWGVGVAFYQAITLVWLNSRLRAFPITARSATEVDARLAWLQIATIAIFTEIVLEFLELLGIHKSYVAILIILIPFILLFHRLQAPFLALCTRLWIAGLLVLAATEAETDLESRYIELDEGQVLYNPRADFLDNWGSELIWVAFAFLFALTATRRITPAFKVAWWRGLVRARHMVLLRRTVRLVIANSSRIAFVGGLISAVVAIFNWMRYASGGGSGQRSRDALLLGAHVYAVAMTALFGRYALGCCDVNAYPALTQTPLTFVAGDLPFVFACCLWGTLLYFARRAGQRLSRAIFCYCLRDHAAGDLRRQQ